MSSTEGDDIRKVIAQTFVAIGTLARALHVEDARASSQHSMPSPPTRQPLIRLLRTQGSFS